MYKSLILVGIIFDLKTTVFMKLEKRFIKYEKYQEFRL